MSNENERRIHVPACEPPGMMPTACEPPGMMPTACKAYNPYEETVPLMLSGDYKARFVAEHRQTKIRYERLKNFCNHIEAAMSHPGKVDMPKHDCDLELLREQQRAMGHYLHALEIRAVVEHIEL